MDRGTAGQSASGPESARGRMAGDIAAAPAGKSWSDSSGRPEPQSPLNITFHREPATLQLAGVVDDSTYPVLTRSLARAALSGATAIRIDLTGVEFCDLAGLRAITSLANPAGQGPGTVRQVTIAHLPAQLTGIIRILGWDATPGLILVEPAAELG
jgi:anti-anti-sigma regulatory factor